MSIINNINRDLLKILPLCSFSQSYEQCYVSPNATTSVHHRSERAYGSHYK